jgi:hypothetical protein
VRATLDSLAPAALQRRAFAVAAGIPQAAPGSPAPVAPGAGASRRARKLRGTPPVGNQRPAEAWSSFSGSWRLVKTGKGEGIGMGGGVAMLGVAALLAILAYALSSAGGTGSWPLALGAAAVLAGAAGARRLIRLSALPARATFDGQVIARWHEESSDENGSTTEYYISVDDGQQGWTFSGQSAHDRVTLGHLVRVTVNPRMRGLIELAVTGRPRTEGPPGTGPSADDLGPPRTEPLLTAAEAAVLPGPEVRTLALPSVGGHGVVHKGRAASLTLMVVGGRLAEINVRAARKRGVPLPGLGDEAWLVNNDRMVVVRAGAMTAKLIMSGCGGPQDGDVLHTLAATVAARLATQAPRGA